MGDTSWTFEKIIILSFLCLGVLMILTGFSIPRRNVVVRNGTFTLKPGRGAIVLIFGWVLVAAIGLFLISQSYQGQEVAALLLVCLFFFGGLYFAYSFYWNRYSFNSSQISKKPFWGTAIAFQKSDLVKFPFEWDTDHWKLIFSPAHVLKLSIFLDGLNQLRNWALTHMLGLTTLMSFTETQSQYFRSLVNTPIFIRIFYVDENFEIGKISNISGIVEALNHDNLLVKLDSNGGNESLRLPTNAEAFREVNEEDDVILLHKDDSEGPSIISEWYTTDSIWA